MSTLRFDISITHSSLYIQMAGSCTPKPAHSSGNSNTESLGIWMASSSMQICYSNENLKGAELLGRQVLVFWDDQVWHAAIVVNYYPEAGKHKLAYRNDDSIEIVDLDKRSWILSPKMLRTEHATVLDGAIIEFKYPKDKRTYRAMIYDYSKEGNKIKVAFLDGNTTEYLRGEGWTIVTSSPCVAKRE